jgi:AAA domain-containing protein
MGEMADYALEQVADYDELYCRHDTFESVLEAGVEDVLYDYDGTRFPLAFSHRSLSSRINRMPIVSKQKPNGNKVKSGTILDRIKPLGFKDDDGIKMLVYGTSGTGKTTFWATWPHPILALICSSLKNPGEGRSINTPENRKRIKTLTINSVADAVEIIKSLRQENPFKTVILDHCSGLQDLTLKEILGLDELPTQKSWGLASQQQYGQSTSQSKEVFRGLLDLECNTVLIAQERTFGGDESGDSEIQTPVVGAALTPSLTGWLNPACDYICQTFKRAKMVENRIKLTGKPDKIQMVRGAGVEYCLRTAPHDIYTTKFRVPKGQEIPECIVDPDFEKIMALINGEGE